MNDVSQTENPIPTSGGTPEAIDRVGQVMSRMRMMIGRRIIGRLAIQNVAPELELSHLDVLEAIRREGEKGEVTVGAIADAMRIDPSRGSRVVAELVARGVLRRDISQADARRSIVVPTELGEQLHREIKDVKMSIITAILSDWPSDEVEVFSKLFDRYISGFEKFYQGHDKGE